MVSFSCENCGDVLTKKKLDPHRNRCRGATFTCIDCMVHFPGLQYRSHTSCMTEDQKYQGALYKDKSKKQNNNNPNASYQNQNQYQNHNQNQNQNRNTNTPNHNKNNTANKVNNNPNNPDMAYNAYVEDYNDDREYDWAEFEDDDSSDDDNESPMEPPPEAPTPPSAIPDDHVDVFDFLVATGQTPNASTVNLPQDLPMPEVESSTSLVRYERKEEEEFFDPASYMEDDEALVEYESAPALVTPAPKHERRKSKESDSKKDKKRKRLHVEVPGDEVMTDAPPVLHSGLTGGLNRMMRPVFPPSPDYSGGDVPEVSPASPLKKSKSKHSKHSKHHSQGHSIFSLISGSTKTKTKTKAKKRKTSKKHSSSKDEKSPKLIEYRPQSKDGKTEAGDGQVILFKPRADVFLSFVNKGPESDRGCSMNKVLKRFHRERQASSDHGVKSLEEKELWRSLRVRQNDRGEIVLFTV